MRNARFSVLSVVATLTVVGVAGCSGQNVASTEKSAQSQTTSRPNSSSTSESPKVDSGATRDGIVGVSYTYDGVVASQYRCSAADADVKVFKAAPENRDVASIQFRPTGSSISLCVPMWNSIQNTVSASARSTSPDLDKMAAIRRESSKTAGAASVGYVSASDGSYHEVDNTSKYNGDFAASRSVGNPWFDSSGRFYYTVSGGDQELVHQVDLSTQKNTILNSGDSDVGFVLNREGEYIPSRPGDRCNSEGPWLGNDRLIQMNGSYQEMASAELGTISDELVCTPGSTSNSTTLLKNQERGRDIWGPVSSPDGTRVAFVSGIRNESTASVYVMNISPVGAPVKIWTGSKQDGFLLTDWR